MTSGTSRRSLASADLPTIADRFEFFLRESLQRGFRNLPELFRTDFANDAILNLMFVRLPGVHLPEQFFKQVR